MDAAIYAHQPVHSVALLQLTARNVYPIHLIFYTKILVHRHVLQGIGQIQSPECANYVLMTA